MENKDAKKRAEKTVFECMECGAKFKRTLKPNTFEMRCPKCHGYDTDIA